MAIKPNTAFLTSYRVYVAAFFVFLAAPLVAAGMFAFNDSVFPSLPWQGFTLDWFFNDTEPKLGMFHDRRLLRGLYYSFVIASFVSLLSGDVSSPATYLRPDGSSKRKPPLAGGSSPAPAAVVGPSAGGATGRSACTGPPLPGG